jgi:hypothetical protein
MQGADDRDDLANLLSEIAREARNQAHTDDAEELDAMATEVRACHGGKHVLEVADWLNVAAAKIRDSRI